MLIDSGNLLSRASRLGAVLDDVQSDFAYPVHASMVGADGTVMLWHWHGIHVKRGITVIGY